MRLLRIESNNILVYDYFDVIYYYDLMLPIRPSVHPNLVNAVPQNPQRECHYIIAQSSGQIWSKVKFSVTPQNMFVARVDDILFPEDQLHCDFTMFCNNPFLWPFLSKAKNLQVVIPVVSLFTSVQVYHAFYKPLEFTVAERDASQCYIKVG